MRRTLLPVAVLVLLTVAVTPALASGRGQPEPLEILLTNDDGFDKPGIQAMKAALRAAGHNVTVVAPDSNFSGSSASITLAAIPFELVDIDEYKAGASPLTTVLIGLTFLGLEPDLIVSGTNDGANLGRFATISGTVGAAIGTLLTDLPAIAFSTDPTLPEDDPDFAEHFEDVADFAVRLIRRLQRRPARGGGLLPEGTILNVNYPALDPEDVAGVRVARQNLVNTGGTDLVFIEVAPGLLAPNVIEGEPEDEPSKGSDQDVFDKGFISVTSMDGDYTSNFLRQFGTAHRLKGLQP